MTDPGDRPGGWIDPLIHAPARLQIVMQLFVIDGADATFLQNRTGLTWGNLSTHISKLEEAGYVTVEKTFHGKKPRTMIRLTKNGRRAFQNYRSKMQEALANPADA
ncbi:MAG: transcriptional regulator [Thermoanaerobaculales bacterium]|nr:transcriptional regulator [Thermoanaerobaculales bacterium]